MKKTVFFIIFLLAFSGANAINYYLSSSLGNDLLNDGKTSDTPWQTIGKLKTVLNVMMPGDSVFFKTDDTFYGQLTITKSGNSTKNIYFGSYGTGRKPCISATTFVSGWTNSSGNIWEANCPDCSSKVTNFFIDGRPQQIGRWPNANTPNKGYLSYESHNDTNSITDNQLTSTINWTGAEAVVRRVRWILDRLTIKSQNAGTLVFTTNVSYEFLDNFGYYIQNDLRTLDQQYEWYYQPATKKFSLYSETDPNSAITSATKLDNVIKMTGVNFIVIENLWFYGSVRQTIDIQNCKYLKIRNTEVDFSGENGVNFYNCENVLFESNLINHTNNNAIMVNGCKKFEMRKNIIKNTALIAGMGLGSDGQYNAVQFGGKNMLAEFNTIDSVGYMGINFSGDSLTIRNNVISNYCITKDDGGGIYTWSDGVTKNYSRKLTGNIVMNAIGAPEGSGWSGVASEGIYIDDRSFNVDIIGNTVYKCGNNGIFIHNASQVAVRNNTVYNNGNQLWLVHDQIAPAFPVTNCTIDSNIFVSREPVQRVAAFTTVDNGIPEMGNFNYNYYCRPLDDNLTFYTQYVDGTTFTDALSLDGWQKKFQKDLYSGKSPIEVAGYKILDVKSKNFFLNPNFDYNTGNWTQWANYNNGKIELSKEGVAGNAMKASITAASGKTDGYMIVVSNSLNLATGKIYRLRFSAKGSSENVTLKLIPRKNGAPYNDVATPRTFLLGTTYQSYEFLLNPMVTEPNSRIDFEIREGQGSIWFDSFELVEVNVEYTNPDNYILFELNSTTFPKTIDIPSGYVDVKGNPVSGAVTLQPFSSVILFRNQSTSVQILPEQIENRVQLFPNPASNFITVKSNNEIFAVNMFDINGRLIRKYANRGSSEFSINGLPNPGLYVIQVLTGAGTEFKKLIVQN